VCADYVQTKDVKNQITHVSNLNNKKREKKENSREETNEKMETERYK